MAGPTVEQISITLNRRWGEACGLADIQDALYRSLVYLNFTPANVGVVVDQDMASVTAQQYPQLLDVAEERGLATICIGLESVNLIAFGIMQDPDKLLPRYKQRSTDKTAFIQRAYGIGLPQLTVGVVDFNFQAEFSPNDFTSWDEI